jgi:hypothetical protein
MPVPRGTGSTAAVACPCIDVHVLSQVTQYSYSTVDQVCARALSSSKISILKCALTVSAHVLRFQYLLTYLVRTNFVPILLYRFSAH